MHLPVCGPLKHPNQDSEPDRRLATWSPAVPGWLQLVTCRAGPRPGPSAAPGRADFRPLATRARQAIMRVPALSPLERTAAAGACSAAVRDSARKDSEPRT